MGLLQRLLRVLFYVAVGGVISIVGAAVFFMNWEPDRGKHPLRGIDVSHHQGDIDWYRVAADDVAFVYIKASEGGDFRDSAFERNWHGARDAGLAWGAYHFFNLCRPGAEQADNFLDALPKGETQLAPVLDLELDGNCALRPPVEEVLADISTFVTRVEQATGQAVILYAPEEFHRPYLKGQGLNRRLWVRSIWRSPSYVDDWSLWQYHQRGDVAGIDGDVDLNIIASGVSLEILLK